MKKFFGLLVQEYRHYALLNYGLAALIGIFVFIGPIVIVQVFPNTPYYNVPDVRLSLIMVSVVSIVLLSIGMFSSSLNRDMKTKELWLHNSQSIYTLIGAKLIYHGLAMIALCFIPYIGLFFVGDLIEGTLLQYLMFGIAGLFLVSMMYIFLIVICLFFIALNTQLAQYIGKFSYVVMLVSFLFMIEIFNRLPSLPFLQIGKVPLSHLNEYLPTFAENRISISLYFDFYIVEEIVMTGIIILIYMMSCKWLERVITR